MPEFKLPDVGEGLTEAEIVSWHVKVGDTVAVNDVVVEIETAKSLVELPIPYAGTVLELLVPAGQTVAVGTPIISIGTAAAAPAPEEVGTPPADGAVEPGLIGGPAPGGRTSVLVGYGPRTTEAKRRARKGAAVPDGTAPAAAQRNLQTAFSTAQEESPELPVEEAPSALPEQPDAVDIGPGTVRVLAKPPVRKLAKDLGVDLREVTPSGPDGVVTRADVHAHASASAETVSVVAAPVSPAVAAGEDRREPVKGVRKLTAEAMVASAFTAPHVTEWVTLDVTATMDLVERLRSHPDLRELRLSPLLVIARAACLALRHHPALNATFDDTAQEIVYKGRVNLGIAAATPRGLVVPNVKNADALPLAALASALDELVATARAGRTQPADMSGGTFTITNVGVFGVDAGTPILNPGETGILAVGAISRRPWVVGPDERIEPRWVTTLALSFDHRVVDGEQGSRFLADVAALLADPAQALLY
jgi:pyruvate dehydrogenase E2 component (dihydrolipoamide acetyltransferase)